MSMILSMTSAAVIAALTLTGAATASLIAGSSTAQLDQGLETVYTDMGLLEKTLRDLDCHVNRLSDNRLAVETACGSLCYKRSRVGEAFRMYLDEIRDRQGLLSSLLEFETTYGRNVQDYTYYHIKNNLTAGMSVENEYFEGDDLYLTINVE